MNDLSDDELTRLRAEFPITERCVYLNHAGVAPTSRRVERAVNEWMQSAAERAILDLDDWVALEEGVRAKAARLLGCAAEEVAYVRNTSHGLALIAEGLPWEAGDAVAFAESAEYPSNVYPWHHLASRGVERVAIEAPGDAVTPAAVARALDAHPRVRLVAVSSTQYASGAVTDLPAIGALCRDRGALLCVDGIQSVGALPLDVRAAGVHFLSADSHKWMLGVCGIGVLFVAREQIERLRPPAVGWKSTTRALDFDRPHFELLPTAARLEEGSLPFALIAGLGAAIDLLLEVGVERIAARLERLVERAARGLEALGCDVGPAPAHRRHVVTFTHPAREAEALGEALTQQEVVASVRRGRVRVSPHVYTSEGEIDRLLEAVRAALP